MTSTTRLGIISDTHGLMRPEALALLAGCEHIVHAGDIGNAGILDQLSAIAPVTAVRGNNDYGDWAEALGASALFPFHGQWIYVIHDLSELDIDPVAAGVHVVISGHSHKPLVASRNGVLYVNPGSAGPRRFSLPIALADLEVHGAHVEARIIDIETVSHGARDGRRSRR
ncbi:YfcE family phosphodiesterase [Ahniella affigens]|uniref:Phosphoesterase n=1 Tax=Ahniella affigens TaxID=2021234 RepID=A0A2P1PP09_9GAMM|nr:metallophosphoesterase family protein [Ahniella affigens]AVP96581.1 YfcE family phosphodiesterase [Ahniella affigens]